MAMRFRLIPSLPLIATAVNNAENQDSAARSLPVIGDVESMWKAANTLRDVIARLARIGHSSQHFEGIR
jgi:2-methylisocitrate lyase-like PEP mutase family enzyme